VLCSMALAWAWEHLTEHGSQAGSARAAGSPMSGQLCCDFLGINKISERGEPVLSKAHVVFAPIGAQNTHVLLRLRCYKLKRKVTG
jgi:hypothetical protein